MSGLTLLIDTAFETCQIGLADGDNIIAQDQTISGGGHDRVLAGMVQRLLARQNVAIKDLVKIAVTTGPGRFTGLRVGIAFARGLALAYGTPLVGLATNDLFAMDLTQAHPTAGPLALLIDVKKGESFVQLVKPALQEMTRVQEQGLVAYLGDIQRSTPLLIGGFVTEATKNTLQNTPIQWLSGFEAPSLSAMARLAVQTTGLHSAAVRPYYGVNVGA